MSVRTLSGIGKMAAGRLLDQYNIRTIAELDTYVQSHTDTEVRALIHQVSMNEKYGRCLEGYYPRKHNKMIYDGLTEHIGIAMPDDGKVRVPVARMGDYVINCKSNGQHQMVPYVPGGVGSDTIISREGVAYPTMGDGYRYGKSCIPPSDLSVAERDNLIRTSPFYRNRQYYKCGCFGSRATCEDFSRGRNNRRLNRSESECVWRNNQCRSL